MKVVSNYFGTKPTQLEEDVMFNSKDPWYFRHFDKIFTGMIIFIGGIFILQIGAMIFIGANPEYVGDFFGRILNGFEARNR